MDFEQANPLRAANAVWTSSWLSHVFFTWVDGLFVKGNTKGYSLSEADLFPLAGVDLPTEVSSVFEAHLKRLQAEGNANPVSGAVRAQFLTPMLWAGGLKVINSSLQFLPPILLNYFLRYLQDVGAGSAAPGVSGTAWEGYVWGVALFLAISLRTLTENAYFHRVVRVGFQIRMAVTTAVYRKALRLSPVARQDTPTGQIVNLMQIDATRLDSVCMQFHVIWDGAFQITGYMVLLGIYIGWSALAGLAVMLLLIPLNFRMMMAMGAYRRVTVKHNDNRIKVTNEALQGIRAIKLYNWETAFINKIGGIRNEELSAIRDYAMQNAGNSTIMQVAPVIVAIATLLVFVGTGGDFTAATAFTAIAILNNLRFPLMFYPMVISQVADAKVSFARLNKFMGQPEVEDRSAAGTAEADAAPTDTPVAVGELAAVVASASPAVVTATAVAAASLPPSRAGIRISAGTFFWEEPAARRVRLVAKAEEDRLAAEKKAKEAAAKAKKGGAAAASPAAVTVAAPAADLPPVLVDVSITIPRGEMWAVVGSVGSGKSALCSAILGELARTAGKVSVHGRTAYVAQTAWVLNATVKKNITFAGDEMKGVSLPPTHPGEPEPCGDEAKYGEVLDACCLRSDVAILPAGDATEIGERGINLSGGQKQRVSLARAAFSGADTFIFDDPLSALDAEVGKAVFDRCLSDVDASTGRPGLLAGCTRLLVTNALQCLPSVHGIIFIQSDATGTGRVVAQGSFVELQASCPAFKEMMDAYGHKEEEAGAKEAAAEAKGARAAAAAAAGTPVAAAATPAAAAIKLMTVEEKKEGAVSIEYYKAYLAASGSVAGTLVLLFFAYLLGQLAQLVSQFWITYWTGDRGYVNHGQGFYMGIFVALGLAAAFFSWVRVVAMSLMGLRASRKLHADLLNAILRAPMAFFDTTPTGRLLARFSKDMDAVDQQLPQQLGMLWMCVFFIAGTLAAIIFATPWFALIVIPVTGVYVSIMNYFRNVSREVKRMDSITRSPIYTHFAETLTGLSTIRAYGLPAKFAARNEAIVAGNVCAWYTLRSCDRWLSIRLELLGNAIVLAAAMLAVGTIATVGETNRGTAAGLAGFSLSYAMAITGLMNWAVRTAAETEQQMNSVERITHYQDNTPNEPYEGPALPALSGKGEEDVEAVMVKVDPAVLAAVAACPGGKPPAGWPSAGAVTFKAYRMRYRPDTPEVLHGISFEVKGGERVGIVGRTGSGKSSLLVSLFRLVEDAGTSGIGSILIDGVPIHALGLNALRSALAIIPQDPVMFSGSVRSNLDPVGFLGPAGPEVDAKLWAALEQVAMADAVRRLPGGLNAPVSEFGESLSVGQRQLLCLARVLLRKCKIILLDEATASLDAASDALVQRTLRDSFPGCTILTIAHRLGTIITADRVLVLDEGRVAQYAHPHELLSATDSVFSALVDELGPAASAAIRERAAESYAARTRAVPSGTGTSNPPQIIP